MAKLEDIQKAGPIIEISNKFRDNEIDRARAKDMTGAHSVPAEDTCCRDNEVDAQGERRQGQDRRISDRRVRAREFKGSS